jgi:hypothetical protein
MFSPSMRAKAGASLFEDSQENFKKFSAPTPRSGRTW